MSELVKKAVEYADSGRYRRHTHGWHDRRDDFISGAREALKMAAEKATAHAALCLTTASLHERAKGADYLSREILSLLPEE